MTMQSKFTAFFLFFFLTTFSSQLCASDVKLLTQYRLHGIDGLEKKLDQELSKQNYWENYLRNIDTKFGYIESYTNILTCNKSKSDLLVYVKDANNSYVLQKNYSAFTGKMKGDKKTEGDLRTPIGIYSLVKKVSHVNEFYGPLAFVTSYPNIYDRYEGKTGQGIWIHGVPTNQKRDSFTKGCIAINNKNIEYLNKKLDIKKTLLIINAQHNYKKVSKIELAKVLSQLYEWRYAWKYNNLQDYLSFYSPDFIRYDGMKIKRFKRYKKRIFAKNENKSIIFKQLDVVPYPMHKNTFKVMFNEFYKSNSFTFTGKKTLIIKLENSKIKIITER